MRVIAAEVFHFHDVCYLCAGPRKQGKHKLRSRADSASLMKRLAFGLLLILVTPACGGHDASPSATTSATTSNALVRPVGFDLDFWNEFVHGTHDNALPVPLRRRTTAPVVYIRTLDDDGVAVDPVTMSAVEQNFRDVALIWGGGSIGLAGVVRDPASHDGQPGTLNVHWSSTAVLGNVCAKSDVGVDGGRIAFNYHGASPDCSCNGLVVSPRVAKHELGHAFGYWHTTTHVDDLMNPILTCDANPSDRERLHAAYAYTLPNGFTN